MTFTVAEKLQIALLCDLGIAPEKRAIDFDFVRRMMESDRVWAVSRRYHNLNLGVPFPPEGEAVREVLEMWEHIEMSFAALEPSEKARVKAKAFLSDDPQFPGYGIKRGCERDQAEIAEILVNDLQEWRLFEGRNLRTVFAMVPAYDRMLTIWHRIRSEQAAIEAERRVIILAAGDELIEVLSERIAPCHREVQPDGGWKAVEPVGFRD